MLIDLVKTYRESFDDVASAPIEAVRNFIFYPVSELLDTSEKADLLNIVHFEAVPPPANLKVKKEHAESIVACDTFEKKYVWAKSLTAMREKMAASVEAVIVLGGKWFGFKGKLPGVLEETLLALQTGRPVYLLGAFGGVALGIANALLGKPISQIDLSFYREHDAGYADFLAEFNDHSLTGEKEKVDFQQILDYLHAHGAGHPSFGLNNGLTQQENERLFYSNNEFEIIGLILHGLKNIIQP